MMGMSSTKPLSRFHCMLSSVLKYASSKHMYCERAACTCCLPVRGAARRSLSRTMAGVSCTVMDCWRLTAGELVGNAPHRPWSPNMLPKQLPRGAPLHGSGINSGGALCWDAR